VVLGLVAGSVLYARGYRRGRRVGRRAAAFAAGVLSVGIALLSPLDAMAEALVSAHMVQHLLLIVVAAPLLVVGRAFTTAFVGLPPSLRVAVARVRTAPWGAVLTRALRRPVVAWSLLTLTLWTWHTPGPYAWAVEVPAAHALEHGCFLLTSMLGWSVALHARARAPLGALGRALFLVASAVQGGLLGAVLLFARTPLYPVHGAGPIRWGLTPLQDQQLAGALMWVPPSAIYLIAAAAILFAFFRALDLGRAEERSGIEVAA
jgi:cytochrome c oxidase assembly factor CtaG